MSDDTTTRPRRCLVTGGCGFVGRDLVRGLRERGDDVVVLDMAGEPGRDDVTMFRGDIRDLDLVRRATKDVDVVFHTASIVHTKFNQIDTVQTINVDGTRNVLRACQDEGVGKLVYVSSASVVYDGEDIENGDEELPYAATTQAPYAATKVTAEREVLAANEPAGLLTCAIRPHVIFGPGDNRFLPAILDRVDAGKLTFSIGDGDKLSDFTYITNLTDALLAAEERLVPGSPVCGQAYFVTNGEPMGFWEFIGRVAEARGAKRPTRRIPYKLAYALAAVVEGIDTLKGGTLNAEGGFSRFSIRYMCTHHYFDLTKARRDLGWEPRVSIDEGIALTMRALDAPRAAA